MINNPIVDLFHFPIFVIAIFRKSRTLKVNLLCFQRKLYIIKPEVKAIAFDANAHQGSNPKGRKMYLVNKPFNGTIIANVESKSDKRISEILTRSNVSSEWEILNDSELDLAFDSYEASLCSLPISITASQFDDKLNVLPPSKWRTILGVEMFHVSERLYGDVVEWFFCYKGKHFQCDQLANQDQTKLASMIKELC